MVAVGRCGGPLGYPAGTLLLAFGSGGAVAVDGDAPVLRPLVA